MPLEQSDIFNIQSSYDFLVDMLTLKTLESRSVRLCSVRAVNAQQRPKIVISKPVGSAVGREERRGGAGDKSIYAGRESCKFYRAEVKTESNERRGGWRASADLRDARRLHHDR